ncbi:hypothetical protein PoB_000953100 [Plakobranchus ocellatus]|uniref:DED domain-containing protein n=1 Tax=Plakobranchus ocellatus TaxID=259542 RepID=A0AAV3YIG0_9GAST|nr:hypothetical protein PoB_000953100 [Plakobranchus ocellatus]
MAAPRDISIPESVQSGDWKFRVMLLSIASKLDKEDVESLKFLFTELSSLGIESFSLRQSQSGGHQTDSQVTLAAARQTPECFWRPP